MGNVSEFLKQRPHWVYRVFDAAGDLLYVGLTAKPETRMANHRCRAKWWGLAVRIDWQTYPDRATAEQIEADAIFDERPRFNLRGKVTRGAA